MDYGVVGARDGAVAGCAGGDYVHVDRNFFCGLDAYVLNFAVGDDYAAFFVDGVGCGDFVPVLLDGENHAVIAAGFFVAFC